MGQLVVFASPIRTGGGIRMLITLAIPFILLSVIAYISIPLVYGGIWISHKLDERLKHHALEDINR